MIRAGWHLEREEEADGAITVFLSLILTCICALMGGLFESARTAGSGWYVQMALNSSLDSLMSCYHREIWDQYRIFVLECDEKDRLAAEMEPQMETYLAAAPFYPFQDGTVQIEAMDAITGQNGDFFAAEVTDYMKMGVWTLESEVSEMPKMAEQMTEAKAVHGIAEGYQENGRKMLRLEEAIEAIGACLQKQEKHLGEVEAAVREADGRSFFQSAETLEKELKRVPGLVSAYEKQADRLAKELDGSEQGAQEVQPDLGETSWGMVQEEMRGYRSYLDEDGARRQEVKKTEKTAHSNEEVLAEAVRKGKEIQDYIDAWEPEDDDDELDEEALWEPVLRITARFQKDGRFRVPAVRDKKKMNVLEAVSRLSGTDLLSLCVPEGTTISDSRVSTSVFPSVLYADGESGKRGGAGTDRDVWAAGLERALLDAYATHFFTRFGQEKTGSFHYEQEYLLQGNASDRENLKRTVNELLAVREAANLAALYGDSEKRAEAEALALAITGLAGIAPITAAATFFIMTVWAFAESVTDVKMLLAGGKIPFFKQAGEWKISLSSLAEKGASIFMEKMDGISLESGTDGRGLDYQGWLKLFFLIQGKSRFCYRMMDMIQNRISEKEPGFRMDRCQYGLSVSYAAQGTLIPFRRTSQKEY